MTENARIIYIAGPYRHWLLDGTRDATQEAEELADEARWARVVAQAGAYPIQPLIASVHIDDAMSEDDWVAADLCLIARLRSNFDGILLRPGAFGTLADSVGAAAELEAARAADLLILYGCQGEERIAEYLETMRLPLAGE